MEALLDSTIATRTVLGLRVTPQGLQSRLPSPWQVRPTTEGASKGANLAVVFNDALFNQDAQGDAAADAVSRYAGFVIPSKHPQTGEEVGFNFRILTANPQAVPGKYKTSRMGTIDREQYLKGVDLDATVTERFRFRDPTGGTVELLLQYRRGIPRRMTSQGNVRSTADPTVLRIYRVDQLVDVVKSVPEGIDRMLSYQLRVTLPEFSDLFDGSEELVSISVSPWYVRQVYGAAGPDLSR